MKVIGMIFSDKKRTQSGFQAHADSAVFSDSEFKVNFYRQTVEFPGMIWKYITIESKDDLNKIAGIPFDAIFSEVTDPYAKMFIMSRFRPRLDK